MNTKHKIHSAEIFLFLLLSVGFVSLVSGLILINKGFCEYERSAIQSRI